MLTETVLERVVGALDKRREAMVDAVLEGMRAAVPSYRELGGRDAEVVRDGVRLTVNQFVDLLCEQRRLSDQELALIESLGGVRAAQGVPMDDMLHSIRAAMSAGWDYILGLVPPDAPTDAVVPAVGHLGDEVFHFMQQSSAVMTAGYLAHQRIGITERVRARDEAVEELLSGVFDSDAEVQRRAGALGIDLQVPHGLLLLALPASAGDAADALRTTKDALVGRLHDALDGSVRAVPTVHAVVAVPMRTEADWEQAVERAVEVAAGERVLVLACDPVTGASGIHRSYTDASRLVRIVRRIGTPPAVLRPDDLGVHRFLFAAGADEGTAFVRRVLGPVLALPGEQRGKLLDVLRATARSKGVADAAEALFVHTKTVSYRLRRLHELTGFDPAHPYDRLQLDTAWLLLDLYPDC